MKRVFLVLFAISFTFFSVAQDDSFKGDIKFELSYEGEGADFAGAFGFSAYHYYFGNDIVRLKLVGGLAYMLGDFIVNSRTGQTIMVSDADETAYILEKKDEVKSTDNVTVVKTKNKEKILGYKCIQYIVTTTTDTSETISEYWMTKKIKIASNLDIDLVNGLEVEGVVGFPLRVVTKVGVLTLTQEAVSINTEPAEASFFKVPTSYATKAFSESPLMQMANK